MKYSIIHKYVQEKGFAVVDTKTGLFVLDGYIYDFTDPGWLALGLIDDTEVFDTTIDRFLTQKPRRYMSIAVEGKTFMVVGAQLGSKDFVAGFTKGRGDKTMYTAQGKEIHLQ